MEAFAVVFLIVSFAFFLLAIAMPKEVVDVGEEEADAAQ